LNSLIRKTEGERNMSEQCAEYVVVYVDADGRDLCESLDLPAYPAYRCMEAAGEHSDYCDAHHPFDLEWD
jgi:hypothetical protein